MGQIFNTVKNYFDGEGWTYQVISPEVFSMVFKGENASWPCVALASDSQTTFAFYGISPVDCPEELQEEMFRFINMANFGFVIGSYEMDTSTGTVRFRTAVNTEHFELNREVVNQLIVYNCQIFDHGLKGIFAIIHGGRSAEEAMEMLRG